MTRTCSWRASLPLRLLLLCILLASQGCGTYVRYTDTIRPQEPITLSSVYVYSFLDIRAPDLGRRMMDEIRQQLAIGLENRGVASAQHWFRDDPLAASFTGWRTAVRIPVGDVIARNAANERRFGSEYRLIAAPLSTRVDGSNYAYDFAWELQDTRTNRIVWSTTARGKHSNIALPDEDPVARARLVVEGLMEQMEVSGLFGVAPAPVDASR